jgi:hypothetical protein
MSVNWECGECPAYIKAKELAEVNGETDTDHEAWTTFASLRHSLIMALLVTGFPSGSWKITERNWEEVYRRLVMLEKVGGAYRSKREVEGDSKSPWVDVSFTPAEIESMVGLAVNAGNKTDAEFHKHMRNISDDAARCRLDAYRREKEAVAAPQQWGAFDAK